MTPEWDVLYRRSEGRHSREWAPRGTARPDGEDGQQNNLVAGGVRNIPIQGTIAHFTPGQCETFPKKETLRPSLLFSLCDSCIQTDANDMVGHYSSNEPRISVDEADPLKTIVFPTLLCLPQCRRLQTALRFSNLGVQCNFDISEIPCSFHEAPTSWLDVMPGSDWWLPTVT